MHKDLDSTTGTMRKRIRKPGCMGFIISGEEEPPPEDRPVCMFGGHSLDFSLMLDSPNPLKEIPFIGRMA